MTNIVSYTVTIIYWVDVRFVVFSSETLLASRVTDLPGISKRTIDYGKLVFILVISVTVISLIINRNKKNDNTVNNYNSNLVANTFI